jgi:hypothetical protein
MTSAHPVYFHVTLPTRFARVHVAIRLALLLAIGTIGCSSVYWLLYLAVPALVALFIQQKGGDRYAADAAPRVVRTLRWLAGAYAYLWLLTDVLPSADSGGPVDLDVELGRTPTAVSALSRLIYSVPALLLATVLSIAASLLWLVGVAVVLVKERIPAPIADFVAMTLRYQCRLIAYHASLVDRYPSLEESTAEHEHAPA